MWTGRPSHWLFRRVYRSGCRAPPPPSTEYKLLPDAVEPVVRIPRTTPPLHVTHHPSTAVSTPSPSYWLSPVTESPSLTFPSFRHLFLHSCCRDSTDCEEIVILFSSGNPSLTWENLQHRNSVISQGRPVFRALARPPPCSVPPGYAVSI